MQVGANYMKNTKTKHIHFLLTAIFTFAFLFLTIPSAQAATEFVTTIKESGGDFSSLASWESTISAGDDMDLTATTTKVFSHSGITGTITASTTVTGATSGATGVAVFATANQILIKNIVGTFQSGEQVQVDSLNYVTISDSGDSPIAVAKIDGAWTNPDTTAVTINGWITSATNFIKIYTTATARHNGKWDNTKYRMETNTTSTHLINVYTNHVRIQGLQIDIASGSYSVGVYVDYLTDGANVQIFNNIIRGIFNKYPNIF